MPKNPLYYKLRADLKKDNPDLMPDALEAIAEAKWAEQYPTAKPEETEAPKAPAEPTLSMTDVQKMLDDQKAEMMKVFNASMKEFQKNQPKAEPAYLPEDADDYDEKGVTFFSYQVGKIITGYRKRGKEFFPPIGSKLVFNNIATYKTRISGQRDEKVIHQCAHTSHSKAEIAFLRNSPEFGIQIFESIKDTLGIDPLVAQEMMEIQNGIMQMNQHAIIQACKHEGIAITQDFDAMKLTLVQKKAQDKQNANMNKLKSQLEEQQKTQMLAQE